MSKNTVTLASFNAPALLNVCDADLDAVEGGQPTDAQFFAGVAVVAVAGGPVGICVAAGALLGYAIAHV